MHDVRGGDDVCAVLEAQPLVAEADSEHRDWAVSHNSPAYTKILAGKQARHVNTHVATS